MSAVTVDWREADIASLTPGQEIGGFEHPRDWDAFGVPIALQMLSLYYTGETNHPDSIPRPVELRGFSPISGTALERQMAKPVIAEAYGI